ncbi:MAG: phage tail sheath subtilisin-like domain-containing protein [Alphaproteobacteria bacterium]
MPEQFLHGVEVVEIDDGARPVRTVKSSVIGLVGTAPKGPINTPTLILGSRTEAVKIFGESAAGFTIPDALDAIFDQAGAMVVVINVADPSDTNHQAQITAAPHVFDENNLINLGHSTVSEVAVINPADSTAYTESTDYTIDQENGIVTRVDAGGIAVGASVNISYKYLDGTKISSGDVIGGVDGSTGAYKGVQCLLAAQSEAKVQPRILIAPGFTHERPSGLANPVVAELMGIAERMRAVIIADCPNSTKEDAITYREDWGSARLYAIYPWAKVYNTQTDLIEEQPLSARIAGLIAKSDNERGFWWSPSNMTINGIIGLSKPIDFTLGDTNCVANYLNENEVATVIQQDGYRLWGNRTTSADPKWAFISVRRTADMINDSLLKAHLWAVDRNISKTYVEDVAEGVNHYLRHLKAIGAIIGGKCWADPALNTPDQITQGKVSFDFDFTPPYPAEHIIFRSRMIDDYLEEIFQ